MEKPKFPPIWWNGQTWYSYGRYYQNGRNERLHRCVYEMANGPITPGFVVHHVDGNICNNVAANLVSMSRADHNRTHNPNSGSAWGWTWEQRSRASLTVWKTTTQRDCTCEGCGIVYPSAGRNARFHSRKCRERFYRRKGAQT